MSDSTAKKITLSIENDLYLQYLQHMFEKAGRPVTAIDFANLPYLVAEDPHGIIILQSDKNEVEMIELCKKLKRLFPDDIKIAFLSSDYTTGESLSNVTDLFLQYPVPFDELSDSISLLRECKKKVLIIDDSKLVHKHLASPLIEAGYEVVSAYDGMEGVAKAKEAKPDLIICDIEMPKMNGFEACAAIRAVAALSEVYIIMSSTLGSASDQRKGFSAGVDEYITKPVIIPELIGRLDKIFRSRLIGRENIILIEPDPLVAKTAAKILAKQGFYPQIAVSLQAALKKLRKLPIDLIISEVDLPDGNALEFARELKNHHTDRVAPALLVFTSQNNQAEVKMVVNAGASGVIPKPFTPDMLIANVERTIATRRAEMEKNQIEKYVSSASKKMAIEKSILAGTDNAARAYKRRATVFFSDIRNFTARCEKYPPKEVVSQINTLFSTMTRVILQTGGDIDKFIGDACMAFWMDENAGVAAERALDAALLMRKEIATMNRENPLFRNDPIYIRFGINSGDIILCDIGAVEARIDLTIIGDPVNLAARLESAGKQYGIDNLVSEFTVKNLLGEFAARIIDIVKVKGKEQPVECYQLLDRLAESGERTNFLMQSYGQAFERYRKGQFDIALKLFNEALEFEADPKTLNPSAIMMARCEQLLATPPTEPWTGVWTLSTK